jgi:hypothetical protein
LETGRVDYVKKRNLSQSAVKSTPEPTEAPGTVRDASELARLLEQKGYVPGESMLFAAVTGGRHEEAHWAERLVPALEFLLKGVPRGRRR